MQSTPNIDHIKRLISSFERRHAVKAGLIETDETFYYLLVEEIRKTQGGITDEGIKVEGVPVIPNAHFELGNITTHPKKEG